MEINQQLSRVIRFFAIIAFGALCIYIINAIVLFFGIGIQNFIIYIIFAISLVVLFYILPSRRDTIFV
jgi:hypothetical protein